MHGESVTVSAREACRDETGDDAGRGNGHEHAGVAAVVDGAQLRLAIAQLDVADRRGARATAATAALRRPAPEPAAAESPLYPGDGNDGGAVALDGLAVDLLRVGVELDDVRDALDEGLVDHRRDLSASM